LHSGVEEMLDTMIMRCSTVPIPSSPLPPFRSSFYLSQQV
jgi:hypothetical protein